LGPSKPEYKRIKELFKTVVANIVEDYNTSIQQSYVAAFKRLNKSALELHYNQSSLFGPIVRFFWG
jgi:hypothetical protein